MNTITNAIVSNVNDQNRVVALDCCHRGWDDCITVETITQGIFERYRAFDDDLEKVPVIRRLNLKNVDVMGNNGKVFPVMQFTLVKRVGDDTPHISHFILEGKGVLKVVVAEEDYFHRNELKEIGEWLLANFYHQ